MTLGEHARYWIPAKKALGPYKQDPLYDEELDGSLRRSRQVAKLLGLPYPRLHYWESIKLTDDLRRKLELIAGPHGPTIVKLLQIRKGELCHNQKENG